MDRGRRVAAEVGAREIVTGRHTYTSDMRLPKMLVGRVLHSVGTSITIVDVYTIAARKIMGAVVVRDGTFTGVALDMTRIRRSSQPGSVRA